MPEAGGGLGSAFLDVIFEPVERPGGRTMAGGDEVTAGLSGGTAGAAETSSAEGGAAGPAGEDNRAGVGVL